MSVCSRNTLRHGRCTILRRPCIYSFHFDREKARWIKRVIYEGEAALNAPVDREQRWALKDFERGSAGTGLQIDARDMDGDGGVLDRCEFARSASVC
jgi:hypothetical protein